VPLLPRQFAPAITVPAQTPSVTAKSPEFTPRVARVYVNGPVPVLESVTVWAVLGVPTPKIPKFNATGDTPAVGPKDAGLDHAEVLTPLVQ
jgi:hypothetical protein